jgi:hypothetical protein
MLLVDDEALVNLALALGMGSIRVGKHRHPLFEGRG